MSLGRKILLAVMCFLTLLCWYKFLRMDFPMQDFSEEVLGVASKNDIDIRASIHWHYLYAVIICPLLCFAAYSKADALKDWIRGNWAKFQSRYTKPGIWWEAADKRVTNLMPRLNFYIFALAVGGIDYELLGLLVWQFVSVPGMVSAGAALLMLALAFWQLPRLHGYRQEKLQQLTYVSQPVAILGACLPFFIEIIYTLHAIQMQISALVLAACYVPFMVWSYLRCQQVRKGQVNDIATPYFYFVAFMALFALNEIRTSMPLSLDFFEWSNHGSAVYGFLSRGQIPMIGNFDPHALSANLGGILYGWLTGDVEGAILAPWRYWNELLTAAGLFIFARQFVPDRYLFLAGWMVPCLTTFNSGYFLGIWLLVYFLYWQKQKQSWVGDLLYGLLFVVGSVFLLDLGASWGIAFLLCGLIYRCRQGGVQALRFCLTNFIIFGLVFYVFLQMLAVSGLSLGEWLQIFLTACNSNQHWAYAALGQKRQLMMVIFIYCVAPAVLLVILVRAVRALKDDISGKLPWTLTFLYLTWLFNLQRAVVRHNVNESSSNGIPCGIIIMMLILYLHWNWSNKRAVVLLSAVMLVLVISFSGPQITYKNFSRVPQIAKTLTQEGSVIHASAPDKKIIADMREFFDSNLQSDETFIDFTNQTLFYAMTGRTKPVYVNQSPGLVSGRKGQEEFLTEIGRCQAPLVLMPYVEEMDYPMQKLPFRERLQRYIDRELHGENEPDTDMKPFCFVDIDGIPHLDRYFLIADYVVDNYRPLCRVGRFAVWCQKERYEEFSAKNQDREFLTDYQYNTEAYYQHDMGEIPYLWGKAPVKGTQIYAQADENSVLIPADLQLGADYYLEVEIKAEKDIKNAMWHLVPSQASKETDYRFNLRQGVHTYKFNCSGDLLWQEHGEKKLWVDVPNGAVVENIRIIHQEGTL